MTPNANPPPPPRTSKTWLGSDLTASPERWTRSWSPDQVAELLAVAADVREGDLVDLDVEALAPPSVRELAAEIHHELLDGLGFTLLTGLPVDDLDRTTAAAAFMILGGLVGTPRSQNAAGHLLGHVLDVDRDLNDPSTRIYQTHERQTFHTDSCDAVALLCLRTARSGGLSMLASVEAVYERVYKRDRALAARLFDPVATDRRDEQPEGGQPWFDIPVLSWFDDHLTVLYQRTYITSCKRFADAPQPDAEYLRALDLFDEVVNQPDVHLKMELAPGDIQFVHNHSLLHDRTAFVDHEDPSLRRHLLRLWLSLPGDRALPPVFEQRYGSIEVGDRGGIMVPGTTLSVTLNP